MKSTGYLTTLMVTVPVESDMSQEVMSQEVNTLHSQEAQLHEIHFLR